jgi:hypothetical protein
VSFALSLRYEKRNKVCEYGFQARDRTPTPSADVYEQRDRLHKVTLLFR